MKNFEQRMNAANERTEEARIKATARENHTEASVLRGIIAGREHAIDVYRSMAAAEERARKRTVAIT